MYLTELYLENTGPISKCHIKPPFADNGNPLPVVVFGPNATGKSIFLSYIVGALTEFAKETFRDIVPPDDLRPITGSKTIKRGEPFSLSLLRFKSTHGNLHYCGKSGVLDSAAYSPAVKLAFSSVWEWPTDGNYQNLSVEKKIVETEMRKGVHVFFRELPIGDLNWLDLNSLRAVMKDPVGRDFNNDFDKPLWINTCVEENIGWILDVFLDSLIDLLPKSQIAGGYSPIFRNMSSSEVRTLTNSAALRQTRRDIESILQVIFQDETAKLLLNFRGLGLSRLVIELRSGKKVQPLQLLARSESQLFHLFATIIRYSEQDNLNKMIRLSDITGLVVIDEVAASLREPIQHGVIPRLMKLFPKVQFIVSSYSSPFLLGMEQTFGPEGVSIFELPTGNRISSERFSKFGTAFRQPQNAKRFEGEIEQRFEGSRPLVLTEGPLDPRYIQAALTQLGHQRLLNSFDLEFVGIEDEKGKTRHGGDQGLNHFRNMYEANSSLFHRPILLLYDCDTRKPDEQIEKLWVRLIPQNTENTKVKKGIENLFPMEIFQDNFYHETAKDDGGYTRSLDKPKFCQWVCEHGSAADFDRFKEVVKILSEFVDAHQLPPV